MIIMMDKKTMLERWAENLERNVRLIEFVRNGLIDSSFNLSEKLRLNLVRLDYVMEDLEAIAYAFRLEAGRCQ